VTATAARRLDQSEADAIVDAVRACTTVADLSGGLAGEVATYLPGRRISGVQIRDEGVIVHVIGRYGPTVNAIAAEVTTAVTSVVGPVEVWVRIDDLQLPPA